METQVPNAIRQDNSNENFTFTNFKPPVHFNS